ncbi:dTMP kinase [Coraliomargarita parva]|uniref:dTMP kinase n=1 Tax=Coraliomargarita parva TaxID=3014050 RepID=UPI0022B50410|nr:dTMP kinase [Coraliomargarita parva]
MAGLFISFEGTEGCGKSTQIRRLSERLQAVGQEVVQTREPGGTALGEAIRHLLQHDPAGEAMCPEAELLLFTASRAQITRELIEPARMSGKCVLCDRFMDSTTVYQGVARKLAAVDVASINRFAVGTTKPDLTVLIDLDAETGLSRAHARAEGPDRMERESLAFFNAVRQGYLNLAEAEADRFLVIDGRQTIDAIEAEIWSAVEAKLKL